MAVHELRESSFDQLPTHVQGLLRPHIGQNEQVIFCVYAESSTYHRYFGGNITFHGSAIVTNSKLIILGRWVNWVEVLTYQEEKWATEHPRSKEETLQGVLTINRNQVRQVRISKEEGFLTMKRGHMVEIDVGQWIRIFFANEGSLCRKFHQALSIIPSKIVTQERITAEPTSKAELVNQLERLAALHKSKALTDAEYEAAKRKLLS